MGLCLVGLVTAGAGGPVDADEPAGTAGASFAATAAAEGFRLGVAAPGYLLADQIVDAGGPMAQATVNALGQSKARAAYPFPGDLALAGPGTLAGFTGLPAPPGYPFVAESESPVRPEAVVEQGPHRLRARSTDRASAAEAGTAAGGGPAVIGRTSAVADVAADDESGTVRAAAGNDVEIVRIGDTLRVGRVASQASAERDRAGALTRRSALAVGEVAIAGQPFGFNENGLVLAGSSVPVPADHAAADRLAEAGITMRYLAPSETPDGVVAAGIEIIQLGRPGVPGAPPEIRLAVTLGRAAAFASGTVAPLVPAVPVPVVAPSPPELPPAPGAGAPVGATVPPGEARTAAIRDGSGVIAVPSGFDLAAVPQSGPMPSTGPAPAVAAGSGAEEGASPASGLRSQWQPIGTLPQPAATGFYAIVALAAVVAIGGVAAIRAWAVKP